MADELKRLMQESKERGPRQERPLAESSLKSIAEDYDPVSAWAAVSMAQEILRLRAENTTLYVEIKELRKALGILSPSEEMRNHYEGKPSVWDK